MRRHTIDLGGSYAITVGLNFWPGASGTSKVTRLPSATWPSMLVNVEFHRACAPRSVRRAQMVAAGASIRALAVNASRKADRVVTAFPASIWTAILPLVR